VKRLLFCTLTCLSLVFSLASVVLWAMSYRSDPLVKTYGDWVNIGMGRVREIKISAGSGWLTVFRARGFANSLSNGIANPYQSIDVANQTDRKFWGFELSREDLYVVEDVDGPNVVPGTQQILAHEAELQIHLTWITAATAILPFWSFIILGRRWIRKRRNMSPYACVRCGYDLRATPEKCPDCGAIPAATKS
jgi:hypothetical protein